MMLLPPLRSLTTTRLQTLADEALENAASFVDLLAMTPTTRRGPRRAIKSAVRRSRREAAFILRILRRRARGYSPILRRLEASFEAVGKGFEKAVAPPPRACVFGTWVVRLAA